MSAGFTVDFITPAREKVPPGGNSTMVGMKSEPFEGVSVLLKVSSVCSVTQQAHMHTHR